MPLPPNHNDNRHSHQPRSTAVSNCSQGGNGCNSQMTQTGMTRQNKMLMEPWDDKPNTMRKQQDDDNDNWGTTTMMGWWVEDWRGKPKRPKRRPTTSLGLLVCFFFVLISFIFTNKLFLVTNYPEPPPATHHCEPLLAGWLSVLDNEPAGGGGQWQGGTMGGEDNDRGGTTGGYRHNRGLNIPNNISIWWAAFACLLSLLCTVTINHWRSLCPPRCLPSVSLFHLIM